MKKLVVSTVLVVCILFWACAGWAEATKIVRFTEAWPTYIDPAIAADFSSSVSVANLYDTLVFPTYDGEVVPHLAESWEVSGDGLTYTFYLRKGVKFHNGEELKAEDVVFSMERLLAIGQGYSYIFKPIVEKVEALDEYTVRFTLKRPFGPFLYALVRLYILNKDEVLAHIEPTGEYGEMGDYGKKWLLTHDAGSGPYMVKEMRLEEYLHAVRFPDYWKPLDPNAPDEFKYIGTTETATVRTLLTKRELEISDFRQPAEFYEAASKIEGIKVAKLFGGSTFFCMMHNRKPPTDDVHFRRALAYAIDYDAIANQIFPGARQARGPVSFILPGHHSEVYQYKRDLAKAREELAKSKYADKLDEYPVDLVWCAEVPDEEKVALLIQANAAELGIKVNVIKTPWMKIIEEVATPETTAHMYLIFVSPHYAEAGSMLQSKYHSSSCGTWEQTEWLQDPELDRMIEDAIATVDKEERFAKYRKIQEYIVDLCPSLFLIDQPENYAYQDYYVDWVAAERAERGERVNPVMGYNHYMPDIRVYPEKREELLRKK
ncbi:ABC transporter substrate-binding protein [Candidatus Caldatribacterium sp.]|uniref:ABC transporter substrate-binding protein n=1 Tax=Candidatus Caldatribacterium sp. TaxID=2282143 RepID=UPI00384215DF|nr:ABC transporter substrate-binding protein [Candidatus Caldatribacterium sp.]